MVLKAQRMVLLLLELSILFQQMQLRQEHLFIWPITELQQALLNTWELLLNMKMELIMGQQLEI